MICELLFCFRTNSIVRSGIFGKGPFAFSPPKMWDPGKNCLLFVLWWLTAKLAWKIKSYMENTSWVIFPFPILTESLSECTVPKFRGSFTGWTSVPTYLKVFLKTLHGGWGSAPNHKPLTHSLCLLSVLHCIPSKNPNQGIIFPEALISIIIYILLLTSESQ